MKIFVTGGTGFVGKHLVPRLLKDGHTLLIFSKDVSQKETIVPAPFRKRVTFLKGNIGEIEKYKKAIKKFRPEVAIHLAWEGIPSADLELNIKNLLGGIAVIKTCIAAGVRSVVVAGSCHEYGEPGRGVNENAVLRPYNTLYAAKSALYLLGVKIAVAHNVGFIWVRPSFIFGPGQRSAALIPSLIDTLKRGGTPHIKTPSWGNDFVYVGDVVDAFARMVKQYKKIGTAVYNIGSGHRTPVLEVVRCVYRECGLTPPPFAMTRAEKIGGFWLDVSKAKREIGWKPRTNLRKGIAEMVAFHKKKNRKNLL